MAKQNSFLNNGRAAKINIIKTDCEMVLQRKRKFDILCVALLHNILTILTVALKKNTFSSKSYACPVRNKTV